MAGLAGTQANAAAGFQTSAALASNFGAQAAALKLAEGAKDAHATQTADQKLATVQRAVDKNLVAPADAQQHASKILDGLHGPTPAAPHQDPVLSHAVFAASGQPGSTIEATTADGTVRVALTDSATATPSTGGAGGAPNAPPAAVSGWPLGVDLSDYQVVDAAGFQNLKDRGKAFAIVKSSQGIADEQKFPEYYGLIRDSGMLRGSYHFFANKHGPDTSDKHFRGSVADQANLAISLVTRLTPGDLPPALDLEDERRGTAKRFPLDEGLSPGEQGYNYRTVHADHDDGRHELLTDIQDFLDRMETALGRTPMIYTSHMWMDSDMMNNPVVMSLYPLWTVYHGKPFSTISVGGWGTDWDFIQYAAEGKWWGLDPYSEPGINITGLDFDAYNGSIHGLRGLADLGHVASHVVGNRNSIAYTEPDGRIRLLEFINGFWHDQDLFGAVSAVDVIGTLPLAAGDPAALAVGNEQVIVYRSADGGVHALTRTITDNNPRWHAVDITGGGGRAIDDPFVLLFDNTVHVVYWDQFNAQVHVSRVNGVWQAESFVDSTGANTPSQISGSAAAYKHQNALHVVSRSRMDGHLFDFTAPAGSAPPQDLVAASHDAANANPSAATYRPTTYTPTGEAPRIVYRALRGPIWQIERDTLTATNLTAASGAPMAAGSPSAVVADTVHIVFRQKDGTINEIYNDAGTWKTRPVCAGAASDPTAHADELGNAAASFRTFSGGIRVARFVNGAWDCQDATQAPDPVIVA